MTSFFTSSLPQRQQHRARHAGREQHAFEAAGDDRADRAEAFFAQHATDGVEAEARLREHRCQYVEAAAEQFAAERSDRCAGQGSAQCGRPELQAALASAEPDAQPDSAGTTTIADSEVSLIVASIPANDASERDSGFGPEPPLSIGSRLRRSICTCSSVGRSG